MRRVALFAVLAALVLAVAPAQAQSRRVIEIRMRSYMFVPSLITVTQGETVVLVLINDDPDGRTHSFAARWLVGKQVNFRGTLFREGVDDERRFFAVAPGQQAEIEFVADQVGSFPFVCGVFDHGARGQAGAVNVLPRP
ncbi:MAG: cupredoxin domain-containing protein [Armatimonadota bacterium]|nr:cupredoxin domain-containing protein [Armatimonadota bacterium]MDR7401127.1 cupredoxin domain-containing protein [Armatimonadota bacterium]MDR7404327.1 cupredoxin domain-containing protein [Armatimonadota bacterium]MDR7436422.1 cupredoxin domain-containing protein [Armatimonadota bacterium]MDR7506249.1 cupredoxin domain-containing protein [Armatimonadota bacterium]